MNFIPYCAMLYMLQHTIHYYLMLYCAVSALLPECSRNPQQAESKGATKKIELEFGVPSIMGVWGI